MAAGAATVVIGFGLYLVRVWYIENRTRNRLIAALQIEIKLSFTEGAQSLSTEFLEKLEKLINDGKKPKIVVYDRHFIFESNQSELSLLKKEVLSAVISYYETDKMVSLALKSFEDEEFLAYPAEMKKSKIDALKELVGKYHAAGTDALKLLDLSKSAR